MNISNYPSNVPTNVRSVFDSYIPFGSDFVYYCVNNSYGDASYRAVYRSIGSKDISEIIATRQSDGTYSFVHNESIQGDYSSISVSHPEYAYTNLKGVGEYYELSSASTLLTVCVIVIASLTILRTVFGGVRWVRQRRLRV